LRFLVDATTALFILRLRYRRSWVQIPPGAPLLFWRITAINQVCFRKLSDRMSYNAIEITREKIRFDVCPVTKGGEEGPYIHD
jgi:hypothetical protein